MYDVILSDPPWSYRNTRTRAAAVRHYKPMKIKDVKNLPISSITSEKCALFLWATPPNIQVALDVIDSWGFTFKTFAWTWLKTTLAGDKFVFGLGNYTRANPEHCLLAFKGHPGHIMSVSDHAVPSWIISPRRKHSQKPDEQYNYIDRLYPETKKLELFARECQKRKGWGKGATD